MYEALILQTIALQDLHSFSQDRARPNAHRGRDVFPDRAAKNNSGPMPAMKPSTELAGPVQDRLVIENFPECDK